MSAVAAVGSGAIASASESTVLKKRPTVCKIELSVVPHQSVADLFHHIGTSFQATAHQF